MHLRPLIARDLPLLDNWLHQAHVITYFGDPTDWLKEIQKNIEGSYWIWYFLFSSDRSIGFAQYYDTQQAPPGIWSNQPKGTAGVDFLIGEPDALGQGLGTQLVFHLIQEIRKRTSFAKIIADPDPENLASIKSLERNGFRLDEKGLYTYVLSAMGRPSQQLQAKGGLTSS